MTSSPSSEQQAQGGVVLLHGIVRTSRSMNPMEKALKTSGFATLNLGYGSRREPLVRLASEIHPAIVDFAGAIDGPIHFVGHSMGGLLARVYLATHRPLQMGMVVMLGAPNQGSEVADLLRSLAIYRAIYGPAGQQLSTQLDATCGRCR